MGRLNLFARLTSIGLLIIIGACLASFPAQAHDLRVFAFVEGDTVKVEAKFSNGRAPTSGEIRVFDGDETLIETHDISPGGVTTFPLAEHAHDTGLMIVVVVGEDHSDYWLLTPADIARGRQGSQ